jgi:hypothetical protein
MFCIGNPCHEAYSGLRERLVHSQIWCSGKDRQCGLGTTYVVFVTFVAQRRRSGTPCESSDGSFLGLHATVAEEMGLTLGLC